MERRSLAGWSILNTRSREQASALTELLEQRGATVVTVPTLAFAPLIPREVLAGVVSRCSGGEWIVLTSATAVRMLTELLDERRFSELRKHPVAAIGDATARAARDRMLEVGFVGTTPRGSHFGRELVRVLEGKSAPRRALVLRAEQGSPAVVEPLRDAGFNVEDIALYRSEIPALEDQERKALREFFSHQGKKLMTVTSGECAKNLRELARREALPLDALKRVAVVTIGPETARAARGAGLQVARSGSQPSLEELVRLVVELAQDTKHPPAGPSGS